MPRHPLLDIDDVPVPLESYLPGIGEVFRRFAAPAQDSGCTSYGVRLPGGERWFVKTPTTPEACGTLERAWRFHRAVRHPAIVPQVHRLGAAVVMPWRDGGLLYAPEHRASFRRLPLPEIHRALDTLLDAHLAVEAAGWQAVDFYDGALLYDFRREALHLIDLDEYRPSPFRLDADRLPGSRRFMAPEEWRRGARIDARTTVYVLGRALRLLLDAGDGERAWRGTPAQSAVLERATREAPGERFADVRELAAAWRTTEGRPA
ncbi:serine/threonine protein kinase [Streptomyces niveiscabiei]|uniref:serine/threonine protein kinase n=1 Tax=Streptomyces niveiscabiei TaxID=164115 RepID=UPI0029A14A98|nr:serine/threonine protein kinase [Streptomyces niveiscabiei]MDX3383553.1 serine/threonine protein kinase [Streptomyces niveiscabiei]